MPRLQCRHCRAYCSPFGRGLCRRCYDDRDTRRMYPAKPIDHDETEADLDRIIAEQMRPENLPPWWEHAEELNGRD